MNLLEPDSDSAFCFAVGVVAVVAIFVYRYLNKGLEAQDK